MCSELNTVIRMHVFRITFVKSVFALRNSLGERTLLKGSLSGENNRRRLLGEQGTLLVNPSAPDSLKRSENDELAK